MSFIFVAKRNRRTGQLRIVSPRPARAPRPKVPKIPLVLVERPNRDTVWYRTKDGKYDVLGHDLTVRIAYGAGPVWSWRPANQTREWSSDMNHFTTKAACLASLAEEMGV